MAGDPIIEDDAALVEALRTGDEKAFLRLVRRHHASLVRVAMSYVPGRAVAEEVAQETWLAVVEGIHRYEGRSSLKTWIFRILLNRARSRGVKERRSAPFSSLAVTAELDGVSVEPDKFLGPEGGEWQGWWRSHPRRWEGDAEDRLVASETVARLRDILVTLPPAQRTVLVLRDVEGFEPAEICQMLDVSEGNLRVLLHRARSKVRAGLASYLFGKEVT